MEVVTLLTSDLLSILGAGPEISAGSQVMAWWFDEYSKYKGFSPACVTGEMQGPHAMYPASGSTATQK